MATDNPRITRITRVAITSGDVDSRVRFTRFTPVLLYRSVPPTPATPGAGWPGVAGRAALGPQMQDERPKADFDPSAASREINAEQVNLALWQDGGLGICAPKLVFRWEPAGGNPMRFGWAAFVWDQQIYMNAEAASWPAYVVPVVNGTGDYSFVFDANVLGAPDADGAQQLEALVFSGGMVDVNPLSMGARAYAELTIPALTTLRVTTTVGGVASDQPFTVAVW